MKKYQFTKISILLFVIGVLLSSCTSSATISEEEIEEIIDTTEPTNPTETAYDITSILTMFDNIDAVSYSVNGNTVTFTTTDVPNHTSPYFETTNNLYEAYNGTNTSWKKNPNEIIEQNITISIPLNPSAATINEATSLGPIGITRNGVVFYNQYAGPNEQELTNEINSFDQYFGHPTGTNQYHYHIEPTYLTETFGSDSFLGLLADGFPVYGPTENGSTVTNEDLDDFHGHTTATADFPNGIYHYHITTEAPYINGNGFYGTPGNITN